MTEPALNFQGRRKQIDMQLILSRTIPFLGGQSFAPRRVREALFRSNGDRFVLYLADNDSSSAGGERIILLDLREALIWLNEPPEQRGAFWT
jgi:hypothetical protein